MPTYDPETGLPYKVRDLGMRLQNCLVKYRDQPTYILHVDGRTLLCMNTRNGEEFNIRVPCTDLDLRPVPLGYVNGTKKSWYVSRKPQRKYKQGLNSLNINIPVQRMRMSVEQFVRSVSLAKTVLNEYPSYENALRSVRKTKHQKAFCRRFALVWDDDLRMVLLHHRGHGVGFIQNGHPVLSEQHAYLQEELENAL